MNCDTVDPDRNSVLMTTASLAEKNTMTADTLLAMIVIRLHSPRTAQKCLVDDLSEGPMDDTVESAIRACDLAGPLLMYLTEIAFGHVFRDTVARGQRVRYQGSHYRPGGKEDLNAKNIKRTVLMMGLAIKSDPLVVCTTEHSSGRRCR